MSQLNSPGKVAFLVHMITNRHTLYTPSVTEFVTACLKGIDTAAALFLNFGTFFHDSSQRCSNCSDMVRNCCPLLTEHG